MDNWNFYMTIFIALIFVFVAFAVFAIGFLLGYKSEDNQIMKRKQQSEIQESDKEKKAKKEWKKFLEYDGTTPNGVE